MPLRGHSILIVESELGSFITALQAAVDHTGAESLVARDPVSALQRCAHFQFSAALVNAEHRTILTPLTEVGIPALLYVRDEQPKAVISSLERFLAA